MSDAVLDLSVREFCARLAAKQPTPGGGSAAALAGALGAALVSMVCQYTVGRERHADVEDAVQRVLGRAEELRAGLEAAVEADVEAYGSYSRAQSMPRDSQAEQSERHAALQGALRESTEVPLGVAESCAELLELAAEAAEIGNPFLISDAAVGAELAAAARASAELNVRLNLGGLDDEAFASECRSRVDAIESRVGARELVGRAQAAVAERAGA